MRPHSSIRRCVYVFDRDGKCLNKRGSKGANSGQVKNPRGVSFLNDNEILIAEESNHRIQQINIKSGTVVKSFGKHGAGKGEFRNPVDVSLDDEGRIAVTDYITAIIGNMSCQRTEKLFPYLETAVQRNLVIQ